MSEFVSYDHQGDIAILTMDDGKANAYGPRMIAGISDSLKRACSDAKIVLIKGKSGVFNAGFDLKIVAGGDAEAASDMRRRGASLLMDIYMHPQPVVMACTGHAIAAGAMLLMTGDYCIGLRGDFKIGLNETSIGRRIPTFGIELARDRLGSNYLTEAVLHAHLYTPERAVDVGYLDEAVEREYFDTAIENQLNYLLTLDASAYAETKKGIRIATEQIIRNSIKAL